MGFPALYRQTKPAFGSTHTAKPGCASSVSASASAAPPLDSAKAELWGRLPARLAPLAAQKNAGA